MTAKQLEKKTTSLEKAFQQAEMAKIRTIYEKDKSIRQLETSKRNLLSKLAELKAQNEALLKVNNEYKENFDKIYERMDALRSQNTSLERKVNRTNDLELTEL